jgi:photosystem II stability/assembly factor-like uncharacterized protein
VVSGQRISWTDNAGKLWLDISPAQVLKADFLPTGEALAVAAQNPRGMWLYRSTNRGISWEGAILSLPEGDWYPLQLEMSSPTEAWVVLQKQTSQAFDEGLLLKTEDGGITWNSYKLPTASPTQFSSDTEGWVVDSLSNTRYKTTDGGQTWQVETEGQFQVDSRVYPINTFHSGWQSGSLGWAVSSLDDCSGEKGKPGYTCAVENLLWQTRDGGLTWTNISLPLVTTIQP